MDLLFAGIFLGCIGLCIWKRLWIALAVLGGVIVLANVFYWGLDSEGGAYITALAGIFFVFPTVVYFNLESREKQERRKTIGKSRRRTGRA